MCHSFSNDSKGLVKYKRGAQLIDSFQNMLNRHHAESDAEDEISLLLKEILDLAHAPAEFSASPENADTILKFRTT